MNAGGEFIRPTGRNSLPEVASARELRIMHVLAPAEVGGLEHVVHALATGQQRRGHRVSVLAVVPKADGEHPFVSEMRSDDVDVVPVAVPPRAYGKERRVVREQCLCFQPDVVHTHGYRSDVVSAGAARRSGVPIVTTVHGFTGGGWKNRIYERMQMHAFRGFDGVVAVSRPLAEHLSHAGIAPGRIHQISNAWAGSGARSDREEVRARLGVPPGVIHVGWVGRLSREKGADILVDALCWLSEIPLVLSVIGDGPERAALVAQATARGVDHRIRWHGLTPRASRLFSAFDVLVVSSRTEGTPIVLFEAMDAGVPIVASRVGGVPDVVSPNEAGLIEPENPRALAEAIRCVANRPAEAKLRARAARNRLDTEFGQESWLARYDALYRSLIHPRRP